jgi:hypothetical protein
MKKMERWKDIKIVREKESDDGGGHGRHRKTRN